MPGFYNQFNSSGFNSETGYAYLVAQTVRNTQIADYTQYQTRRNVQQSDVETVQTRRNVQLSYDATFQTYRYKRSLYDTAFFAIRNLTKPYEDQFQTHRKIVLLSDVQLQTYRYKYQPYSLTHQTRRRVFLPTLGSAQLVRELTLLYQPTAQTLRDLIKYKEYAYQTKRIACILALETVQTTRTLESLSQIDLKLLDVDYIGEITITGNGSYEYNLKRIRLFVNESQLVSFMLINRTGHDIYNIRIAFLDTFDYKDLLSVSYHMFGMRYDGTVDEALSRVEVGLHPEQMTKVLQDRPATIKQDTLSNGQGVLVYMKITQPDTILPITHIPIQILFEV